MRLLLDLGNSAVKWALATPGAPEWLTGRLSYAQVDDPEGVVRALQSALDAQPTPECICIASVLSPAWQSRLEAELRRTWPVPIRRLHSTASAAGVANGYERPEQLGVDRWAALIGARACAPAGACIVDVGTAITVDGLDAEGRHLGGAIYPGPRLHQEALARGTARLADAASHACAALPARSTDAAIAGGISVGMAAAVQALAGEILAVCPDGAARLLTGGAAATVAPALGAGWQHRPHLVLEGLLHWSMHEGLR